MNKQLQNIYEYRWHDNMYSKDFISQNNVAYKDDQYSISNKNNRLKKIIERALKN